MHTANIYRITEISTWIPFAFHCGFTYILLGKPFGHCLNPYSGKNCPCVHVCCMCVHISKCVGSQCHLRSPSAFLSLSLPSSLKTGKVFHQIWNSLLVRLAGQKFPTILLSLPPVKCWGCECSFLLLAGFVWRWRFGLRLSRLSNTCSYGVISPIFSLTVCCMNSNWSQ